MKTQALVFAALALAACGKLPASPDFGSTVSFSALYDSHLASCASCHTPGDAGRVAGIEQTLDFSTRLSAIVSLSGEASGLTGALAACNGVPFLAGSKPDDTMVLAVLDPTARSKYQSKASAGCQGSILTDEAAKVGGLPDSFLTDLADWIGQGTNDN